MFYVNWSLFTVRTPPPPPLCPTTSHYPDLNVLKRWFLERLEEVTAHTYPLGYPLFFIYKASLQYIEVTWQTICPPQDIWDPGYHLPSYLLRRDRNFHVITT